MSNKEKMPIYKIGKPILGFIYKLWYCPTIIGKENIPKDGGILLVGNHIHIMDQCNVILATKRCIHYMAKKEYFDPKYKEGKFPWFFKGAGCIPVDRSKKDDEAILSAMEVLQNDEALGLFPEGTRNMVKEEKAREWYDKYIDDSISFLDFFKKFKKNKTSLVNYFEELMEKKIITKDEFYDNVYDVDSFLKDLIMNKRITKDEYYNHSLLPLKYGAVSLAHKTHSLIVPYAISGSYKFRGKDLVIRIGEPFFVDDDLEKANDKLDYVIKELLKKNEKNSGK